MSKNGSEFAAFVEHTAVTYKTHKVLDYFGQDIPSDLDNDIAETIRRFLSKTREHQQQFQEGMPKEVRSLLGIFGHRAATIAARNEDLEMLKLGLVATAVSNYKIPKKRRVEVGLSIFYHVARRLEQNPIDLFEDVAQIANAPMAEALLKFGKSGVVNIRNYGWQELKTDDGVKYKWG